MATGFPQRVNSKSKVTSVCYKQYWNTALQPNTPVWSARTFWCFSSEGNPFFHPVNKQTMRGGMERQKQKNERQMVKKEM